MRCVDHRFWLLYDSFQLLLNSSGEHTDYFSASVLSYLWACVVLCIEQVNLE